MKTAPLIRALGDLGVGQMLIHTGQHYDARMSDVFCTDLGLLKADVNLPPAAMCRAAPARAVWQVTVAG